MSEQYSLDTVLDTLDELKIWKWVDEILDHAKERIFWDRLNEKNIVEFKCFVRNFTSLYYMMKAKFSQIYRSSGERYFEHLREVVNNVLDLPHPTTDKLLIALAHDSIEDTDITFEWLNEFYWQKVALWVEAISKQPWKQYLNDDEKNLLENLESRKRDLTEWGYKSLADLKALWKQRRNYDYFSHIQNFWNLMEYIHLLAESKWIYLNIEELKEIAQDVLDVKLADRIHNLSTQWDPDDTATVRRKVEETKKYFIEIAKERNPSAYKKLWSLLLHLEIQLHNASKKVNHILEN